MNDYKSVWNRQGASKLDEHKVVSDYPRWIKRTSVLNRKMKRKINKMRKSK